MRDVISFSVPYEGEVIDIQKAAQEQAKERDRIWREEQTRQYNIRIMHKTGIPQAIEQAAADTGETPAMYIKKAVADRLRQEGYLTGSVVLNSNEEKHRIRIEKEGRK